MSTKRLMTLGEAADWLGMEGANRTQRLRRLLLRFEERSGRTVLVRVGKGDKRERYLVTRAAVRAACPELVDHHDTILRGMREAYRDTRRELAATREAIEDMRSDLNAMQASIRAAARR